MRLKVISFNIQNGYTVNYNYALLGADIAAENADLVGIQELDRFTRRNGNQDGMTLLASAAGYEHYAYTKTIDYMGGEYGTAILSKYPIKHFAVLPMESHRDEQRAASIAVIEIDGKELTYINTHLSLGRADARKEQFETLAKLVEEKRHYLLTGDFNTEDFAEFAPIKGANLVNNEENKFLSCAGEAIDNIVYPMSFTLVSSFVRNETVHSDHFMIGAVMEL